MKAICFWCKLAEGRIETFCVIRLRGTKQIWFLSPEAEGNVAHETFRPMRLRETKPIYFGVNWLREGLKYFIHETEGNKTDTVFES